MIGGQWRRKRLKFVVREPIRNGVGEPGDFDEVSWPRYVRITDIAGPRSLRADTFRSLPPRIASEALLEVGDVLVAAVGATYGRAYFHATDIGPACFAGYLVRVRPSPDILPSLVAYWTESRDYWDQVNSAVVQATIQNFSAEKVRQLRIPVPPEAAQRAIARFLDRKTAEIDALVAKKERLLELLEEKRTALITQAVTKGITPGVEMKESGIGWIGAVPTHWEVVVLARVVDWRRRITYGIVQPGTLDPSGIPMVRGQDYSRGWAPIDSIFRVSPEIEAPYSRSRLKPGDLVVTIVGAGVGNVAQVPDWLDGANLTQTTARVAVDSSTTRAKFIGYFFQSGAARAAVELAVRGAAQPTLTLANLARFRVTVPPLAEQDAIVSLLDASSKAIAELASRVRDAIDRLREYRTSLITAAVTGYLEVPMP